MRRRVPIRCLFALAILSGTSASAQDRAQPTSPPRLGLIMLLSWPAVRDDLKLDATQIQKSEDVIQRLKEKLQSQRGEILSVPRNERASKSADLARPVVDEAFQAIHEFLKPEHLQRLREIQFQSRGFQALDDAEVKEKLKLTPEQLVKLAELRKEMTATTALVARDRRDDPQTAMNNAYRARQASVSRIPTVLDDYQKKVWHELSGEPFSVP